MHLRSTRIIPSVLISSLALLLPLGAAQAAPAAPSAVPRPVTTVEARRASTLTLPTGEHLQVSGAKGKE